MAIEDFTALMKNRVFRNWYSVLPSGKANTIKKTNYAEFNSFAHQGRSASKALQGSREEIDKSMVDFVVSKDQLIKLLNGDTAAANKILANAKELQGSLGYSDLSYNQVVDPKTGKVIQDQIFIKNTQFSKLNTQVTNMLGALIDAQDQDLQKSVTSTLRANLKGSDRGHVFGYTNILLNRAKSEVAGLREYSKGSDNEITENQVKIFEKFIDSVIDHLRNLDKASSDILGLDTEVFANYKKGVDATGKEVYLVEYQGGIINQGAGRDVAGILGQKLGSTGLRSILANSAEDIVESKLESFIETYLAESGKGLPDIFEQRSSSALKDMISDQVLKELDITDFKPTAKPAKGKTKLPKMPLRRVTGQKEYSGELKKQIAMLEATKRKAKTKLRTKKGSFTSLVKLQNIINAQLIEQVRQNMGTGDRRDILNYRTGRFASSVQVENMSMSKNGMITAFYTYMKNPYATFSAGGRQSVPASRDPKLLISKSIREIAQEQVSNRLRAVLV